MATLPELVRAIDDGPGGPQVGALFDLDGTIVDGYTAGCLLPRSPAPARHRRGRARAVDRRVRRQHASAAIPSRLGPIAIAGLRGQSRAALEEIGERLFDERIAQRRSGRTRAS